MNNRKSAIFVSLLLCTIFLQGADCEKNKKEQEPERYDFKTEGFKAIRLPRDLSFLDFAKSRNDSFKKCLFVISKADVEEKNQLRLVQKEINKKLPSDLTKIVFDYGFLNCFFTKVYLVNGKHKTRLLKNSSVKKIDHVAYLEAEDGKRLTIGDSSITGVKTGVAYTCPDRRHTVFFLTQALPDESVLK